jgi:hypothetical protein
MSKPKKPRPRRQCTATNRQGNRCGKPPILGASVCKNHGGASPQVRRKAKERLLDIIDPDRTLRAAASLAYSDIRLLFDDKGNLKPIHKLPDSIAYAIAGVEVVKRNITQGDGVVDTIHKVKLWDKPRTIEMLMKHFGMLTEKVEITTNDQVVARLQAARKRGGE